MGDKPRYTDFLTKEFFEEHYVKKGMSYPAIRKMLAQEGKNVSVYVLHKYAKKHQIGRTVSEAMRELDWTVSFMNSEIQEALDGFLLGDGHIESRTGAARLKCSLQYNEFCKFLMSHFLSYKPSVEQYQDQSMSSGYSWHGFTKTHPDLNIQHKRWYENKGSKIIKKVPCDVAITPKSVLLWYLGDGSVVNNRQSNTIVICFATDAFRPEDNDRLVGLLGKVGIICHRNNSNRIQIEAKGVPGFFSFIGRKSPIKCYQYKFDVPEWRFEAKRMSDVAEELGVDYQRLAYLVKIGEIPCYRASDMGRPRFLPEHIEACKEMIRKGKL